MRRSGIIIKWEDAKGYGFIAPDHGGADLFLHHRAVVDRERRPQLGDRVYYENGHTPGKGPCAEKVTLRPGPAPGDPTPATAPRTRPSRPPRRRPGAGPSRALDFILILLLPADFLAAAWLAAARNIIPPWVATLYGGMSFLTFSAYALDKFRAQRGKWRIAESTLHLFEMAGGWPGAFAAQRLLRHKTRKLPFQITYWLIVLAHLAFWVWYGKMWLEKSI